MIGEVDAVGGQPEEVLQLPDPEEAVVVERSRRSTSPAACMKSAVGAPEASGTKGFSVTFPAASDCQPHSTEPRYVS